MTVIATDSFTGTANTPITTYSASWEKISNIGNDIVRIGTANQARFSGNGSTENAVRRTETFPNDQYAKATVVSVVNGVWFGVEVRGGALSSDTWYGYYSDGANSYLFKNVSGTFTDLMTPAAAFAPADEIEIRAVGTTISAYKNSGLIASATDSSIASGKPGLCGYGDSPSALLDNFEAGDFSGGGTIEQPFIKRFGGVKFATPPRSGWWK